MPHAFCSSHASSLQPHLDHGYRPRGQIDQFKLVFLVNLNLVGLTYCRRSLSGCARASPGPAAAESERERLGLGAARGLGEFYSKLRIIHIGGSRSRAAPAHGVEWPRPQPGRLGLGLGRVPGTPEPRRIGVHNDNLNEAIVLEFERASGIPRRSRNNIVQGRQGQRAGWRRHRASSQVSPPVCRWTCTSSAWERAEGSRWKRHCASTPPFAQPQLE
jgi:hypothetical protein